MFGKDLTRRSGACCELCEASGVGLSVYEVPPIPADPDFEHCIFICDTCRDQIDHPKRRVGDHWRCLGKSIWSSVPAVQAISVKLLSQLQTDWSAELLETLYLEPEVEAWVDQMEL
nr:phnA protein [Motiliproteus sediminis]